MMHPILIALLATLGATLAVHLGLADAVLAVAKRIASCAKCSSFWITLTVLIALGYPLLASAGLSLVGSYLSHWFSLVLVKLNQIYEKLWQRINKNR